MLLQRLNSLTGLSRGASFPLFSSHPSTETTLNAIFVQLDIKSPSPTLGLKLTWPSVRHATHNAQKAVNGKKNGPGTHLGAKKTGDSYVIPGNIIFRQRGTHWWPGENCGMGRDHTIYATESGYVRYYKDPQKHPLRQYIGVVFERGMSLPSPENRPRRRRLGMMPVPMTPSPTSSAILEISELEGEGGEDSKNLGPMKPKKERRGEEGRKLVIKDGYMFREANWEIGRAAERAKVTVRKFKPGDRWTAWKKASKRKAVNTEKRRLGRLRKR